MSEKNQRKARRAAAVMREWLSNEGVTKCADISLESLVDGVMAAFNGNEKEVRFRAFMRAVVGTAYQIGRHSPERRVCAR